jgi:DNA-binding NtrC family response regulator
MSQSRLQALIVDSDAKVSAAFASAAAMGNCAATCVVSATDALIALDRQAFDVAVVDLPAGDDSVVSLLRLLGERQPSIALVVTGAAPSVETAILAYELCAFRFVPKPYDVERLVATLREAAAHACTAMQNADLLARVRRGKQEWEQTFDAIGDAIAVFDARGALLRGNTALSKSRLRAARSSA